VEPMKPMKPMAPMKPQQAWWPGDLGQPDSAGGQNDRRYAYFDAAHRLAVQIDGQVKVYDTGSHRINGFAQQQGSGNSLSFSTDRGPLDLKSLPVVS
jgi:hypothetical protein